MTQAYQRAFRHLFDGTVEQYDPWDATYRTAGPQYPGTTMCSVFRTFQGWTALSRHGPRPGRPAHRADPGAMGYLMLRPLLADVPDDDMCGVTVNQVFPVSEKWHAPLLRALTGIPDVRAGDSVWWHCDMIHSVAPVTSQQGWGNVMYIPAAPWCPRNERVRRPASGTRSSPGRARATSPPSTTSAPGPTGSSPRTSTPPAAAASASAERYAPRSSARWAGRPGPGRRRPRPGSSPGGPSPGAGRRGGGDARRRDRADQHSDHEAAEHGDAVRVQEDQQNDRAGRGHRG